VAGELLTPSLGEPVRFLETLKASRRCHRQSAAAPRIAVMLRESGASSTLRPLGSITDVPESWVARSSLVKPGDDT
jgi:hypothetical protein